MTNLSNSLTLDQETFVKVRKWYLLAFATIALTVIIAQILIQQHLSSQLNDSRVINVAGRQRAFSQKLVKDALLLNTAKTESDLTKHLTNLSKTLKVWTVSHQGLQFGNDSIGLPKESDPEILALYNEINPHHQAMVLAAQSILQSNEQVGGFATQIDQLLQNERYFLVKMDSIVNEYDAKSKSKLQNLRYKELSLFALSLLILGLEIVFIFRPLSLQIKRTISSLISSKKESEERAAENKQLLVEKERSLSRLQELNFAIDNAALFASIRNDGSVVFMSKKLQSLLHLKETDLSKPIAEILTNEEGQQQYLREILTNKRKQIRTEEIELKIKDSQRIWLDMSIIPIHQSGLEQSVLILCNDITLRKKNQEKIEELTKQNYEDDIRRQQIQASQIVESQEEERKRIAKDIHDGIGQMLTALKFNIESINLDHLEKSKEKIDYLKTLTADLIKGVRTATFNLNPPELQDHGLLPALQKMTQELRKLTGKNILFENNVHDNIRFNSLAETNIYRVTQEAVNNAIKYADSSYILVTIALNEEMLSIKIDDDGKGFDPKKIETAPKNNSEGGMGVYFMKERINYINGRIFINSLRGEGTRVTINYNLKNEKNEGEK
ncbi:ATP-binding protein [Spongiivirga sp. MCCC 1A20706]|uniref:PAS domain-containing sensor histidine kinase n=1 Tax=Spongiivirga sp. MCCC 1A20706 TaxID=3160963 RepID=UPI0039779CFD